MDAIELLTQRTSCGKLDLPLPDKRQLEIIFKSALRAPDHANLRPYQFLVYDNQESLKGLGEKFLQAKLADNPNLDDASRERTLGLPLRAPMVIVAIAKVKDHPKVPALEQIITTGCAVHGMLYCLEALGFAGYWRTGDLATNSTLKSILGIEQQDEIVGFLYLGTPLIKAKKELTANTSDFFINQ